MDVVKEILCVRAPGKRLVLLGKTVLKTCAEPPHRARERVKVKWRACDLCKQVSRFIAEAQLAKEAKDEKVRQLYGNAWAVKVEREHGFVIISLEAKVHLLSLRFAPSSRAVFVLLLRLLLLLPLVSLCLLLLDVICRIGDHDVRWKERSSNFGPRGRQEGREGWRDEHKKTRYPITRTYPSTVRQRYNFVPEGPGCDVGPKVKVLRLPSLLICTLVCFLSSVLGFCFAREPAS